jgi:hypothetical protein
MEELSAVVKRNTFRRTVTVCQCHRMTVTACQCHRMTQHAEPLHQRVMFWFATVHEDYVNCIDDLIARIYKLLEIGLKATRCAYVGALAISSSVFLTTQIYDKLYLSRCSY